MSAALTELAVAEASLSRLRAILSLAATPPPAPAPAAPPPLITAPSSNAGLQNASAFYASIRASDVIFGGKLTPEQFAGCEADLQLGAGRLPLSWMAYCLGTDYHESGHTMQPVKERGTGDKDGDGWDDWFERYDTGKLAAALGNTPEADGDGVRLAGRGKVQITGERNYHRANLRLHELGILKPGEDLEANPDLALRMDVAAACLVLGLLEGWFTGKKLNDYLPATANRAQFANARRIVNGTDKADLIAGYALAFQAALISGGWK